MGDALRGAEFRSFKLERQHGQGPRSPTIFPYTEEWSFVMAPQETYGFGRSSKVEQPPLWLELALKATLK